MNQRPSARPLLLRTLLGVVALVLGLYLLLRHDSKPGAVSPSPTVSPPASTRSAEIPATLPTGDGVAIVPPRADVAAKKQDAVAAVVAFAADGKLIVTHPAGEVELRDFSTAPRQTLAAKHGNIRAVAVAGDAIALGGAEALVVWHRVSGSESALPTADVTAVVFTSDGRTLISGHGNGEVRLWDAISWSALATLRPGVGAVRAIAFSPDGRTIAVAGSGVALWDIAARQPKMKLAAADTASGVAFSPDGRLLAIAGASGVSLWETTFWQKQATIAAGNVVTHVAFWRGGSVIVSAAADGAIQLWDLPTRQRVVTLSPAAGAIASLALSPDDRTIAAGGANGVFTWDATTRSSRPLD